MDGNYENIKRLPPPKPKRTAKLNCFDGLVILVGAIIMGIGVGTVIQGGNPIYAKANIFAGIIGVCIIRLSLMVWRRTAKGFFPYEFPVTYAAITVIAIVQLLMH